jgi:hypothetical protein
MYRDAGTVKGSSSEHAQERLAAIEAGNGTYSDDEPFTVPASLYIGFNNTAPLWKAFLNSAV